jgi:UDP-N-acetylmuramoylalanine--D-glutamate ligase
VLGATLHIGPGETRALPDDVDLVVTSPGVPPTSPVIREAGDRGVPVWGEVELAWRLRDPDHPGAWLAVTGTNGKTTTVQMLQTILQAQGLNSIACGNVGLPIVEAVMDPEPYDVYAVAL